MAKLAGRGGFYGGVLRSETPLVDDQLRRIAPSIFAENAHESRSQRYTYIPTIDVLNGLRREGFQPYMVCQGSTRVPGKADFTKHMVRMRHVSDQAKTEANEIILVNSHDGTSSYQMLSGVLRFVCNNGLVCGEGIEDYRVPHKGNIVDQVIEKAWTTLDGFGYIREVTDEMKSVQLTDSQAERFAQAALQIRYEPERDENTGEWLAAPIESRQLLMTRRAEDNRRDVWTTFNRVQENAVRGGLSARSSNNRRIRTREVVGIDSSLDLNRKLWTLAQFVAQGIAQTA